MDLHDLNVFPINDENRFEDFNENAWILGHSDVAGLLNQLTKKYVFYK